MTITANQLRVSQATSTDYQNKTRVTVEYLVESDDGVIVYADIIASGVIPSFGEQYGSMNAWCSAYDARPEPQNRRVWYFTVVYETRNSNWSSTNSDDPCKEPAHVWYGVYVQNQVVEFGYTFDGGGAITDVRDTPTDKIVNTAKEAFVPALEENRIDLAIFIEKNYRDFDPNDITKFQNTVNSGPITIGGIDFVMGQGWLMAIKHKLLFDQDGERYDRMHFEIVKRDTGWDKKTLSRGMYQLEPLTVPGVLEPITEALVNPDKFTEGTAQGDRRVTTPKFLNDVGVYVADIDDAAELTFKTKWQLGWDTLDLPVKKDGTS